jgi:hypothetical protein
LKVVSSLTHKHTERLNRSSLFLLVLAVTEILYAVTYGDELVKANGFHDLFDVAFVGVAAYSARSAKHARWWHSFRCNIGPTAIILLTLGLFVGLVLEIGTPEPGPRDWRSVALLALSTIASLNLARDSLKQQGLLRTVLSWHFSVDVGASALAAVASTFALFHPAEGLPEASTWIVLLATAYAAYKIINHVRRLPHFKRNCRADGPKLHLV